MSYNFTAPVELTPVDWLQLLHPVLMILFVYPVVGATIRLGILVRERRLEINPIAATVPVEHVDHGRWVTTGTVVAVLLALGANLARNGAAAGGIPLLLPAAVALVGCLTLWRSRRAATRATGALRSWGAVILLVIVQFADNVAAQTVLRDATLWPLQYASAVLGLGVTVGLLAVAAGPGVATRRRARPQGSVA